MKCNSCNFFQAKEPALIKARLFPSIRCYKKTLAASLASFCFLYDERFLFWRNFKFALCGGGFAKNRRGEAAKNQKIFAFGVFFLVRQAMIWTKNLFMLY
ncbi:MAG: hypothetical protein SOX15_01965 [Eubacteriales bacterium]|nr:hypothetical protein [Eubacteriales bacterium]